MMEFNNFFSKFKINITTKNNHLYKMAFTHNSYANENNLNYTYQRLEFLGDAILSKEISLFLYLNFPNKNEGEITSLRSIMVRKETLSAISFHLKLGKIILLGVGEIKTKGYAKNNILADVLESLIAAIYLDKGEMFVRNFIKDNVIDYIIENNLLNTVIDYKTQLQEQLQSNNSLMPEYKVVKKNNLHNKILYNIIVMIDEIPYGSGQGSSIKEAEQNAAKAALDKLVTHIK